MNLWKPVDTIANWLKDSLSAHAQLRLGVICVFGSIPLMVIGFLVNEPFLVYQMSAGALLLTGVGIVVGAEVLVQAEEAEKAAEQTCPHCNRPI